MQRINALIMPLMVYILGDIATTEIISNSWNQNLSIVTVDHHSYVWNFATTECNFCCGYIMTDTVCALLKHYFTNKNNYFSNVLKTWNIQILRFILLSNLFTSYKKYPKYY